ncbi:hypothetical protein CBW24_14760 [Pacificitalea manganoxidans]|uniref:SseB protein N-terminal domain-containing protein n=1 Tax=Pacificitalea manganoxidans TaxID=1411902 RepID=A0A291M2E6_9RHOB|nr:SseB family protein [Pacificitalea manganoxidans]ATI43141.1 hypothetical protein CBW24_14760 [Pacificitalea manganoxidans]MDR6306919.1 hypothetical protein [Pacificitalea manganoxidans]
MTQETRTPLDDAHAAMEAAPDSETARLRFYERLADGELYMLLDAEPEGRNITPRVFPLEDGPVVLLFDLEDRLSDFAAGAVPYAALSGRAVAELLAGQQIGLGVNLGHPSAIILPYQSVDWLAETLGHRPSETQDHPEQLSAPRGLPESLLTGLDAKLARTAGLARFAYLVAVTYRGGRKGHLLAFVDSVPGAEDALAQAAGEALTFSGIEAGEMDVAFFRASDPVAARLAQAGLRFDLPEPEQIEPRQQTAPGSDPSRPPILR